MTTATRYMVSYTLLAPSGTIWNRVRIVRTLDEARHLAANLSQQDEVLTVNITTEVTTISNEVVFAREVTK